MSKSVLSIGLSIVGIALFAIPGIGTALGLGALSILGATVSVAQVIGAGLLLASSVLLGPAKPKMPASLNNGGIDRLYGRLDPTTPRKMLFGNTAGATDVRDQTYTGSDQEYLEQIICIASHEVNSIYELWLDNEKAWSSASGVVSKYADFLTVTPRTVGTSANGIAIDSTWTATATLTGCAYIHVKMLLIHDAGDGTNDSPFATGITNRITIRSKGALIYDPRLDSTVTGGAGTHRADDQSTWAWDDDGSRNPALQLLWYLLGWKINSKLAVGMGLPKARIDLESFITAANACDESVTRNGGGTEPRYRSDGVLSEGDDRTAVVEALCASMNAVMRDSGGKLSLTVLHDDLASPAASFDESSVIGEIQWDQTPDLSATFNIVRGRRIDPTNNALYQPVDYPEVSISSPDGIDRIDTMDYPLVQSNGQAQRLAKQRLERNQYQGRLQLTGKPEWWRVSVGDPIEFSHSAFGWTDKLFRVAGQQINRDGQTQVVLVEENAAIYAWDNSEAPEVTPGTPTVYDAAVNHPVQRGINDALVGNTVIDPISDVIVYADSSGTVKSGELPRDVLITASNGTADVTASGTWTRTVASGVTCTIGAATGVLNITALAVAEASVPVSFAYNGVTRTGTVHIIRQDDPPTSGGTGATGGTSQSTASLGDTNGTSYDPATAVSGTLSVVAGSGGQVACTAPIGFKRTPGTAAGHTGTAGKWQWRVPAGTWADISTEIASSSDAGTEAESGTINFAGSISVAQTKTGLTNGSTYEFRLLWRRSDTDGTANDVYRASGIMTATGS